jgi:hypothetical protein
MLGNQYLYLSLISFGSNLKRFVVALKVPVVPGAQFPREDL